MAIEKVKSKRGKLKNIKRFGRIGVLMGGPSTEREISLKSGKAVYENLKDLGIDVVAIDISTADVRESIRLIKLKKIDCAFLALHGRFGEDGQIQEILDSLRIPYTGSNAMASRLAMDKIASHKLFEIYGVAVPRYAVMDKSSYSTGWRLDSNLSFPLVIKPSTHGSSIGLSIIDKKEELDDAVNLAFKFDERILIEEYIEGKEITVGILDNKALPVIEIIPKKRFFDYEAKYNSGMTDYIVPANLGDEITRKVQSVAISAHKLLGCFGCCRVDIILDKVNIPFILEVNTIPGLTPTSLLPKAAKKAGMEFMDLCIRLIELAYEKSRNACAV